MSTPKIVRWGVKFNVLETAYEMGQRTDYIEEKTIIFSTRQAAQEFAAQTESVSHTSSSADASSPLIFKVE